MIKRILVGLGCEPFSSVAVRTAIQLAECHGSELTGISIIDVERLLNVGPQPIGAASAAHELREFRFGETKRIVEEQIAAFEAACREASVGYHVRRVSGDPFELMVSAARYHDLVLCGLQGLFEHGVLDEPPNELVKLVVEGVRPILAVSRQDREIRQVLIAYSGSMESAKTMKRFVQQRLWPEMTLRIVTFDHTPEVAGELLQDAADYCRAHGFESSTEHVPGSPKNQLLPYAEQMKADLIVVGNSAKSLLRRRLFGETSLHAIQRATIPLFLSQ